MPLPRIASLTTFMLLIVVGISRSEEQSVGDDDKGAGDGRTLGHIIRGSHALADTFINGLFDGTYHLGNHVGQFISPGIAAGLPQHIHAPPVVPLYNNFPGYGYDDGYLAHSPVLGHQYPGGYHRPGFHGTYASKPFSAIDRDSHRDLEKVPYDFETDKTLFLAKR